ncbi:acyltransferase family protein [Aurantibacillus circumpalustris]|uniref:acyltransferase family protein n=1 Tax=Aurantibacillus circumpalustris TaxID=3036359 RepID=UPI00295A5B1E|nr:acyltransferase [Aurantibacillus circumpalustris]
MQNRNFGLDIIRAVSIFLVIIAHYFSFSVELGLVGVQFFFILSGFLIGQILIKQFTAGASSNEVLKFWKRRWYRTLPLYYLILVLKILFYSNPFGWKMIVYFFFLQANFVGISFFSVSWSLVVEEWFYIFLPLATFLFFRNGIEKKKFLYFLLTIIILFFCARFMWNYFEKGIILYQFDCMLIGVFLALLKLKFNYLYLKLNSLPLFVVGLCAVVLLTFSLGDIKLVPLFDVFYRVVWVFLLSVSITFIVPFVEQSEFVNIKLKQFKFLYLPITWTSILTYSIYLIHMEVYRFIYLSNQLAGFMLCLSVIYLCSFIIYYFYEHPMMMLREEFSFRQYKKSIQTPF